LFVILRSVATKDLLYSQEILRFAQDDMLLPQSLWSCFAARQAGHMAAAPAVDISTKSH